VNRRYVPGIRIKRAFSGNEKQNDFTGIGFLNEDLRIPDAFIESSSDP
jgi:hypothetical protein